MDHLLLLFDILDVDAGPDVGYGGVGALKLVVQPDQVAHHVPPKSRLGSDHTSKQSSSESAREDVLK